MYRTEQWLVSCQTLKIKKKNNKNLKENVCNRNVRTVLEPETYSTAVSRSFTFDLSRSRKGRTQVFWYSPRIGSFWQKTDTAIEFPLENGFSLHTTIYGVRLCTKTAGT